jgi:hypothetical protein
MYQLILKFQKNLKNHVFLKYQKYLKKHLFQSFHYFR